MDLHVFAKLWWMRTNILPSESCSQYKTFIFHILLVLSHPTRTLSQREAHSIPIPILPNEKNKPTIVIRSHVIYKRSTKVVLFKVLVYVDTIANLVRTCSCLWWEMNMKGGGVRKNWKEWYKMRTPWKILFWQRIKRIASNHKEWQELKNKNFYFFFLRNKKEWKRIERS